MNNELFTRPETHSIISGQTTRFQYLVKGVAGESIDLSSGSYTAAWRMRDYSVENGEALISKSYPDAGIVVDPTNNSRFIVTLYSTDTAALNGLYVYQFEISNGENTYKLVMGNLHVIPEI